MDASQSSMVALDASTIATDSSVIRRRRKRRRTTIVDQLQQINISNGEVGVPNQILEQAVVDDNSQTLTSSSGSEDEDEDHDRDHHHHHGRILPPSDVELAQRAVMRELVFGRPPDLPPPNPVDRQLQALVRKSLQNIQAGHHPFELNRITASQDDMHIDPVYTRPTNPAFFDTFEVACTGLVPPFPTPSSPLRKRSNSLPEGLMDDLEDHSMEFG